MSPLRRATKVYKSDTTGEIITTICVFDWRNVLELNCDSGALYAHGSPRTLIITNYDSFFVEGTIDAFFAEMQEWEAYDAQQVVGLPFSKQ